MIRILLILMIAASWPAQAAELDPSDPEDSVVLFRKLACLRLADGAPRPEYFNGPAFSHIPGQPDQHLFDIIGMGMRQCQTVDHPTRGSGFRSFTTNLLIYLDKDTGEILETWDNPFTGETVRVMPTVFRRIVTPAILPIKEDGTLLNAHIIKRFEHLSSYLENQFAFFPHPLSKDYPEYVGTLPYQRVNFENRLALTAELFDPDVTEMTFVQQTWARVGPWQPWMKMGDLPGLLLWNTFASQVESVDDFPEPMLSYLNDNYPELLAAPAMTDAPSASTTFDQFPAFVDGQMP